MCAWWDKVSAATDGELDEPERDAALEHAQCCATCSAMISAIGPISQKAHQRSPVDSAVLTQRERRWLGGTWTRRLLAIAAIVIATEAVPAYVRGDGLSAESHAARHLASWQIGFGVGLFVAAWMSRMSHAMLAFGATFATLTITAKVIDVIGGHRGPWADPVHLVEVIAVFLLWRLTPAHLLPWTRRRTTPPETDPPGSSAQPPLRLIRPEPDDPTDHR